MHTARVEFDWDMSPTPDIAVRTLEVVIDDGDKQTYDVGATAGHFEIVASVDSMIRFNTVIQNAAGETVASVVASFRVPKPLVPDTNLRAKVLEYIPDDEPPPA